MNIRIDNPLIESSDLKPQNSQAGSAGIKSFGDFLTDKLKEVNELKHHSNELNKKLVTGEIDNMHQVMIASEKADIALQYTIQIRNKLLDAYNEIMRMQI